MALVLATPVLVAGWSHRPSASWLSFPFRKTTFLVTEASSSAGWLLLVEGAIAKSRGYSKVENDHVASRPGRGIMLSISIADQVQPLVEKTINGCGVLTVNEATFTI
jgi:hypothetical protein